VAQQGIYSMTEEHLLNNIQQQVDEGVSSVVLHCIPMSHKRSNL